jgi:F-type H+-transporting ATPase subunit delta
MKTKERLLAESLFSLSEVFGLEERVGEELVAISRALKEKSELKDLLDSEKVEFEKKRNILKKLFAGKVSAQTLSFISLLCELGESRKIDSLAIEYQKVLKERMERLAEVRIPFPLESPEKEKLEEKVKEVVGEDVRVRFVVDESILGGFKLRIGDKLIDASLRTQLEKIKDLAGKR